MENSPPSPARFPWGAIVGIVVLALVGVAMLAYAMLNLTGAPAAATATSAPPVITPPTPAQVVALPTSTLVPSPAPTTEPPTAAATDTSSAPTEPTLTVAQVVNIRGGPGTNYQVLGTIPEGGSAAVTGRDSTGQWLVIRTAAVTQGWVRGDLVKFTGDAASLPIIAAPPPPPATNTAPPPAGNSSRGIVGNYFNVESLNAAPNALVWFNFKVTNTTDTAIDYGVLAAHTDTTGVTAKSWSKATLQARGVLEWRDHIEFPQAGTYPVYLAICYGTYEACMAYQAPWERLSPNVTVTIK